MSYADHERLKELLRGKSYPSRGETSLSTLSAGGADEVTIARVEAAANIVSKGSIWATSRSTRYRRPDWPQK